MPSSSRQTQHRHRGFDSFGTEPRVQKDVDSLGSRLGRGVRYSMLDADHVVGVGVVVQEFDRVTADAAPLEQQLLRMRVATVRLMIRRIPSRRCGWVEWASLVPIQSRWYLVGSAYIIAAIRIGKDHPRRRGFGDTTDGDAKRAMDLEWILVGTTGFFAFAFVVVLFLTILEWYKPWLIPDWLLPYSIRQWLFVALLAFGFVAVFCLIWTLNMPEPRIR